MDKKIYSVNYTIVAIVQGQRFEPLPAQEIVEAYDKYDALQQAKISANVKWNTNQKLEFQWGRIEKVGRVE